MKNITSFNLKKPGILLAEEDIYKDGDTYYIGLSFEQEPELGEGSSSLDISQFPLEDILDEYNVYVDDFCDEVNSNDNKQCRLIVASKDIEDLRSLKSIIGKHVFNASFCEDGKEYIKLIVE